MMVIAQSGSSDCGPYWFCGCHLKDNLIGRDYYIQ